ncbi:UDP-N-acetylglucosamine 1-carboxyvinyltransferase [Phototrophicus methaneseepsis]|uniref:UDP-N-acetylglucosamine 1-carboxyvinyltransferase n=1 Tax=Phototrophicus methaneseepsis TaxID=2710758 RepID=A0A7S8E5Z3_9CHLR|nr:UDP-N-acetylglucosamine 1-carboxyvinyltransferase [Phototrophicus methaneseepsis]QPC81009.1 UDP-N-acetylglucosamine 1-carboxyvinyltransferase [Phototrophicus methaneseepsis]
MSDTAFKINGGKPLYGEIVAQRSKNAVLPMIAAALIPQSGKTVLHGVPEIADVLVALDLAREVGAVVDHDLETHTVTIDASTVNNGTLPPALTERFRGSVLFLAPMITRMGHVRLPGSGGCDIGTRKIDFHHRGFARLGADVVYLDDGTTIIDNKADRLKGAPLYLDLPSHTGTENLVMGAALAEGTTIIENASAEPEVLDFCHFLIKMGANIEGIGTRRLTIHGVKELHAVEYTPIPDRLVIGLLVMSAAIAGGDVTIHQAEPEHLRLVIAKLDQMGVEITVEGDSIRVQRDPSEPLTPINILTEFYPGFPTDLQPCIAALSTIAQGKSFIRERIFENRYDFVDGLIAMGADILISQNNVCIVNGVKGLKAAPVRAASIRAGAALLLAGIGAKGETIIENGYQIDRGHEYIEKQLRQLGADVERITKETQPLLELA